MERIESVDNKKIKYLKKLGRKKFRDETGQFLVENLRIIHDAIQSGFIPIQVFVTEELLSSQNEKLKFVVEGSEEIFLINEKIDKSFSSLSTPSGICAVFKKSENKIGDGNVVYLNAVSDPGNLGTILRTALAFGLENVVVDEKCADVFGSKTISAAKDAIFKVNLAVDEDLNFLKEIKGEKKILATRLEGGVDVGEALKFNENICVVFGNEANGIGEEVTGLADGFVRIGMSDRIESLNVAISAGIVLWEIWKKK